MSADATPTPLPLEGVIVLEFCQAMAGPYACQLLADMGAHVIKVEKPGGDDSRGMPPHFVGDTSLYFMAPNRNKESVVLDLKTPEGRADAESLIAYADIVVENNRPGVMQRLGLDFEAAKALNPNVVYASISGFGQDGPYREMAAYDPIVQAMSGVMSLTGPDGGPPVRAGVPIGDLCAGMIAALAATGCYHAAQKDGIARHIDTSMLDVQVSLLSYHMAYFLKSGVVPGPQGQGHSGVPEQGMFECQDGRAILVTPMSEKMWPALCDALGRPDLARDASLATRRARIDRREDLRRQFEAILLTAPSADWIARLRVAGIPVTTINSVDMVAEDEQIRHRQLIKTTHYGNEEVKLIGSAIRINGRTQTVVAPPVLDDGRDRLRAEGILGSTNAHGVAGNE